MSLKTPSYDLDENLQTNKWLNSKFDKVDPEQEAKLKRNFPFLFEELSDSRLPPEKVKERLNMERDSNKNIQENELSKLKNELNRDDSRINYEQENLDDIKEVFSMVLEQHWDKLTNQEKDKLKEFQWKIHPNISSEEAKSLAKEMDIFFVWLQESWRFDNSKFLKINQDTRSISERLKDAGKGTADKLKKAMPWLYDDNKETGDNDLKNTEKKESINNAQESLSEQEQIESRKEGLKFAEKSLQINNLWSYLLELKNIKTFDRNYYNDLIENIKDRSSLKDAQKSSNFLNWFLWFHIIMLWQILRDTEVSYSNKEWIKNAIESLVNIAEESWFYDLKEDKWLFVKQLKELSQGSFLEYNEMDTLAKNIWEWELKARNKWNSTRIREFAIQMLDWSEK